MKKIILSGLFLVFSLSCISAGQTGDKSSKSSATNGKMSFKFYGFVRNYVTYDSRKTMSVLSDMFNIIPLDENKNMYGEDLNSVGKTRFIAASTRLGVNIAGPEVFNAKVSAKIEADFAGTGSTNYLLRLRQAYVKLNWKSSDLLMGQAWHPMIDGLLPELISMNAGAPFNPINRSPQIRYDYNIGKLQLTGAAIWQLQYSCPGPLGTSANYQLNSNIPELYLGLNYKYADWKLATGIDILTIKPYTQFEDNRGEQRPVNNMLTSISGHVSVSYAKDLWSFKAKAIYGRNNSNMHMLTGYGITDIKDDGSLKYSSLRNFDSWASVFYGKKYKVGIFGGYFKNLGSKDDFYVNSQTDLPVIFVRGYNNINDMYRGCASFSYNVSGFTFGLEYEATSVNYGNIVEQDGSVSDCHNVIDHRLVGMVKYSF
jgi:hypothetical protein